MRRLVTSTTALLLAAGAALADPPADWAAHEEEVYSKCLAASGFSPARPAGQIVSFGDEVGYDAVVVAGRYPQPHMKGDEGQVLCLFDRRSRTAHIAEADHIVRPRKHKPK